MFQRIGEHFLDSFVAHLDRTLDLHLRVRSGGNITRENAQQPVGIDLELHSDPRLSAPRGSERDLELPQFPIVPCHLAFALQHCDPHGALICGGIRKHLARLARDRRVARNDAHS